MEDKSLEYEKIHVHGRTCGIAHIRINGVTSWRLRSFDPKISDNLITVDWPEDRYTGLDHFKLCVQLQNPFLQQEGLTTVST